MNKLFRRVLLPGGGGQLGTSGFLGGGVVPPRDLRGLSWGGVGLTPQEAEEGQTPQKLWLESLVLKKRSQRQSISSGKSLFHYKYFECFLIFTFIRTVDQKTKIVTWSQRRQRPSGSSANMGCRVMTVYSGN